MSAKKQEPSHVDCDDIDRLHERGLTASPSAFAAVVFHLGCVIARELRLLRAGVKP